jgi:hypothetical protein
MVAVCLTALRVILAILTLGYLGIEFVADLPKFLFIENVVYAIIYALGILYAQSPTVLSVLAVIAAFNSGRVTRSVITPEGKIFDDKPHVVASHAGLALLLLAAAVLAAFCR